MAASFHGNPIGESPRKVSTSGLARKLVQLMWFVKIVSISRQVNHKRVNNKHEGEFL